MTFSMKLTHENTHFIPTLLILLYFVFNVDVVFNSSHSAKAAYFFIYFFIFGCSFGNTCFNSS